ncbi:MAG: hypothetical protein ACF8R7_08345 [Phycisphaerales bacterium JB039]
MAHALGLVTFAGTATMADTVVWSQPGGDPGAGGGNPVSYYFSDNGTTSPGEGRAADGFNVATSSQMSLTSVRWWGSGQVWFVQYNPDPFDGILSFAVTILENSGGLPGSQVWTASIDKDDITATAAGFGSEYATLSKYETALVGVPTLESGSYFISIVAELASPTGADRWAWEGITGDGSPQWDGSKWSTNPGVDLAFELSGTVTTVPLPAPVLLTGVGLLGLIPLRRRLVRSA